MITAALDAAAVAERAFVLGYPLVLTQRTMAQATAVTRRDPATMRAPVNQLVLCRDTPDTLRLSAWLDLAAEPLVLSVPDTSGRYYVLWMRDAFNTVFASVGARTTGTGSRAFGLLGPDCHAVRLGRRVDAGRLADAHGAPGRVRRGRLRARRRTAGLGARAVPRSAR